MRITDISQRDLKASEKGAVIHWDDSLAGFGARVTANGVKSFVLTYGRARKRITIGRVGIISLGEARSKAREVLARRTLGKKDNPAISFEKAFEQFQASRLKANKASTAKTTTRQLTVHFLPKFRLEKIGDIAGSDISNVLDNLADTPSERSHAHAAIRLFLRWCEERGYLSNSPIRRLKAPDISASRDHVLADDELKKVARCALDGQTAFHKITALLLLTGQRRGQIAAMRGEWADRQTTLITFPKEVMKGNREHVISYGHLAASKLATLPETGLLFPAEGTENPFNAFIKPKIAFDMECGVTGWVLHDFRPLRNRSNDWMIDRQMQKTETFTGIAGINQQDRAIQESMGRIVDRAREHLGPADRAVVATHELLLEAADRVQRNEDPPGVAPSYYELRAAEGVLPKGVNWRNELLLLMYPQTSGDASADSLDRARQKPKVLAEAAPRAQSLTFTAG